MRANRPKNSNSEGAAGRFETCPYISIFRPDSHPGVPARPTKDLLQHGIGHERPGLGTN